MPEDAESTEATDKGKSRFLHYVAGRAWRRAAEQDGPLRLG
jgi:hypothetical protein